MAERKQVADTAGGSIWCIHGNLQRAAVWDRFTHAFPCPVRTVDLYDSPAGGSDRWAASFCEQVRREAPGPAHYLIGYSLGGRLAWHACLEDPDMWRGIVVIGADPGLEHQDQRDRQLAHDQDWARKFLHDNWEETVSRWSVPATLASAVSGRTKLTATNAKVRIFTVIENTPQD